jgi:hypothetical protein
VTEAIHLEVAAFAAARELPGHDTAQLRLLLTRQQRAYARDDVNAFFAALEAGDARGGGNLLSRHARRVLDYGPALQSAYPELFTQ